MNIYQTKFLILYIIFFSHCKNKDIINICPDYKFRDSIYNSNSSNYLHFSTINNYDTGYLFSTESYEAFTYFLNNIDVQNYMLSIRPEFNVIIENPKLFIKNQFIFKPEYNTTLRKSEKKTVIKSKYSFTYVLYENDPSYFIDRTYLISIIMGLYYSPEYQLKIHFNRFTIGSVSEIEMDCFAEKICSSFHLEKCN